MKLCAIQPPYGHTRALAEAAVDFIIQELNACDDSSIDLILTPEYSNTPGTLSSEEAIPFAHAHLQRLEEAAIAAARRCKALVALSYSAQACGKERNTIRLFRPDGSVAGEYWKQQLVPSEPVGHGVDNSYALAPRTPTIVEVDGLRFGFLICYDAYFEEYIEALAYCKPDIVLVAAMQRQESCDNLQMLNRMLAFHTNAFVLRASYSMGAEATVCGTSLVAGPDGKILADFGQQTGRLICDIGDPKRKYHRSNAFRGKMILNDQFIEQGRTPWAYRPCGPFVRLDDKRMPYPRICAHRGFHTTTLPENSLPAFGAAIALGADEIEFDLWDSADGLPVCLHDCVLERVSDGVGDVQERTLAELKALDFSKGCDASMAGLQIPTLEEILQHFARHAVMNIHMKTRPGQKRYSRDFLVRVAALIHQYDCDGYAYLMGTPAVHEAAMEICPHIPRCMGAEEDMERMQIVDRALDFQCAKVQFFKPHLNQQLIDRAHDNGLHCNCFWSDSPEEARHLHRMGIDTILTNNFLQIKNGCS